MRWIRPLSAHAEEPAELLGAKAHGLVELHRLGLAVPAGFVVTTEACRAFLRDGRLPAGLAEELATAMAGLEAATGRHFGGSHRPLAVSVRSGAAVSMPGMMTTILNLGLTTAATAALAAETGDPRFALDSRLRFLQGFANALTGTNTATGLEGGSGDGGRARAADAEGVPGGGGMTRAAGLEGGSGDGGRARAADAEGVPGDGGMTRAAGLEGGSGDSGVARAAGLEGGAGGGGAAGVVGPGGVRDSGAGADVAGPGLVPGGAEAGLGGAVEEVERVIRRRRGEPMPDDAALQLALAVETVFSSWDTPRARTYRELHEIPHDLGTAVVVQAMVFGNRDEHSGTGVAFSRDPNTGENVPYGEVLSGHQGEDVVSGRKLTRPLGELAGREPAVWADLLDALRRVERHYRDACYVEFTFQAGELWLLQVRPGRFGGAAAVRVAADLADEHLISRREALLRVSPQHLRHVRTPRIAAPERADVVARGVGACPGVAAGRVATTTDAAVRMAADGPVILVRPETSPDDMRGLAAAAGIVTARGGPASHAAVVARAMGKPAVVGVAGLVIDGAVARTGGRVLGEGTLVTIDGTGGQVAIGTPPVAVNAADTHLRRLLAWADDVSGDHSERGEDQRLSAAHAALRRA